MFVALADALRRNGRLAEALTVLRSGFRVHPEYSPGRVVLARVHLEMGNRALAVGVLEEVVRGDPENLAGGTLLAKLLVEDGRTRDARPIVERLMMIGGQDAGVRALSAAIGVRGARATVRGADPFDSPAIAERFVARGAYPRALSVWRRIAAAHPENARIREHILEVERAIAGLSNVEGEAMVAGGRTTLPGAADMAMALEVAEQGLPAPKRAHQFGALSAGLWRQT